MAAYADNTLNGLLALNNNNLADIDVSDLLMDAPLLAQLYAMKSSYSTQHQYLKETGAASGTFRGVNEGVANTVAQRELITATLKILDASLARDKAVAMGYKGGKEAFMALEIKAALKAAFYEAEKQIISGVGNQAAGFAGLAALFPKSNSDMVYNAGGTSDGTIKTSVYAIRSTENDVALLLGQDGNIEVGDIYETQVPASDFASSGKLISSVAVSILGWLGLQYGSIYSAGRMCNITNESGKTLDDDKIAELLSLFPESRPPTHLVMNRKALAQLRNSRTATNPSGAPAPFPTEAFGVPIVLTGAIGNTETLLTT